MRDIADVLPVIVRGNIFDLLPMIFTSIRCALRCAGDILTMIGIRCLLRRAGYLAAMIVGVLAILIRRCVTRTGSGRGC